MKAVVVEIKNPFAAAMTEDGRIIRIKNKNYAIGEVIEMKKISFSKKTIFAAAGAAAVFVLGCAGIWAYNTPHTYVSLDVNPSIEYELNVFDRVIDYTAVNDDGEAILENLDLNNMDINDAIDQTLQEITSQGYLSDSEPGGVVIAVSEGDNEEKSQEIADSLEEKAQSSLEEAGVQAEIEAIGIGAKRVAEAKALGVTPGKLNLVQKLQESNPDAEISTEEWLKQPVKSIMKAIKENRKNPENTVNPAETAISTTDETAAETSIPANSQSTETAAQTSATVQETQRNKEKEMNANSNSNKNKKSEETAAQTTQIETSQTTAAPVSETTKKEVPANSNAQKQTEKETETETEKQNNGKNDNQNSGNNGNQSNGNSNSSSDKSNAGNSNSNSSKSKKN